MMGYQVRLTSSNKREWAEAFRNKKWQICVASSGPQALVKMPIFGVT